MARPSGGEQRRPRANARGLDDDVVDLYRSHYRSFVRLAGFLVDDRGTAEEVVQDAFVAYARGHRPDDPDRRVAYLRSAVLNGARSELRKRRVRRRHLRSVGPPPSAPGADRDALLAEDERQMLRILRTLPRRQREVLVLRYYADLSEREIAEALDITPGSVKTHAHRGLQQIESLLRPTNPDDEEAP